MKHFGVIKFVNLFLHPLPCDGDPLLVIGFTMNLSVVEELQEATNFDSWKTFILLANIVAFLTSAVFVCGSWKEFEMYSGSQSYVVAETLYILGLWKEMERPACLGSETDTSVKALLDTSKSSSMISIFGFGYDEQKILKIQVPLMIKRSPRRNIGILKTSLRRMLAKEKKQLNRI